jgi:endonuclease/exonuclease/phosphatase family metal-dependent hydrolase
MSSSDAHRLTAMTFNIRYDEESDARRWATRRVPAIANIRAHDPDLLAVQEPTSAQWEDLTAALPGWSRFGSPPAADLMDADLPGGFFRNDRFHRRATGSFQLTDEPARTCAWVRLRDRTAGRELVFASTHFDTDADAWVASAKALHAQLDAVANGAPLIVAGDFNCAAGSEAHAYLRRAAGYRDTWTEAGHADEGVLTFHGFTPLTGLPDEPERLEEWLNATSPPDGEFAHYPPHVRANGNYRIDWILLRGPLVCSGAVIDSRHGDAQPSDHYPVIAAVEWTA